MYFAAQVEVEDKVEFEDKFVVEVPLFPHRIPVPDICHERHEYIRVKFFGRCKFLQI